MDHPAQPLVAVSSVHQQDMRSLFVVLADKVVGEKGFSAARRPKNELISVGDDSSLHGQVGNIHMHRYPVLAVCQPDAERTGRAPVIGLSGKEAYGLFQEGIKGFFRWKVACISGDSRPIDDRCVNGVIPWRAFHHGQLAARVVPDAAELFRILRPGDDVAVASDGKHSFGMCLIKIHLRPLLVNGIAPAVF